MAESTFEDRAFRDPAGAFETPEDVLKASHLSPEQKRIVLERWRQHTGSPITGENASGGEPNLVTRLGRALAFLDEETGKQETTHDQGFYTSVSEAGASETGASETGGTDREPSR
jgi:hypothetical protein